MIAHYHFTEISLQVQGYSLSHARKITQVATSFYSPLRQRWSDKRDGTEVLPCVSNSTEESGQLSADTALSLR